MSSRWIPLHTQPRGVGGPETPSDTRRGPRKPRSPLCTQQPLLLPALALTVCKELLMFVKKYYLFRNVMVLKQVHFSFKGMISERPLSLQARTDGVSLATPFFTY